MKMEHKNLYQKENYNEHTMTQKINSNSSSTEKLNQISKTEQFYILRKN